MDSPKRMANMRIGVDAITVPDGSNPRSPEGFPSLKIQTGAPKLAVIESRLMSTALSGRKMDPKVRNSTAPVTPTTIATAHGTDPMKLARKSRDREDNPPVSPSMAP